MFFLSSWGWQPVCGKMTFLIQKAPLYSEGVAATLSGNGIQPKVMLREVADPWLICSFSEELCREATQLHGKQEEWQYFIRKSNPRETQVPPGEARAACSVAASISRNFVAKRKKKKRIFYHLLLFLKLPLYQTTDLCNLLTICTENVLLAFFSSFPLPSSILPSHFCLIHQGDEQFHCGFSVYSPIERKQGGVLAPFLQAPSLYP